MLIRPGQGRTYFSYVAMSYRGRSTRRISESVYLPWYTFQSATRATMTARIAGPHCLGACGGVDSADGILDASHKTITLGVYLYTVDF